MRNFMFSRLMEAAGGDASGGAGGDGGAGAAGGDGGTPWYAPLAGDNAETTELLKPFAKAEDFITSYRTTTEEAKALKAKQPGDWRKDAAGGDADMEKLLTRYSSVKEFGKAYKEAQDKIRTTQLAKPLAKDATPEQVTEWRKANGIPEKPEGYFTTLKEGRVIGKDDQGLFNSVAERLHAKNVPPEVMSDMVEWYYENEAKEAAGVAEVSKKHQQESDDLLRAEWGVDHLNNSNNINNYIAGQPEGLQKALNGFGADGRQLKHNPEFMKWLSGVAREHMPASMLTQGGGESAMKSYDTRLAELIKLSANHHSEYWKGPKASALQAEHIQINEKIAVLKDRMK